MTATLKRPRSQALIQQFDSVFDLYRDLYLRIFDVVYPAIESRGFTERNQTANFSKAYEKLHPNAITWFEMPFSDQNHMDAIIADPAEKTLLLIEAKRFDYVGPKLRSVEADIERINRAMHMDENSIRDRFPEYDSFDRRYGVILADVWTENNEKERLLRSFQTNGFPREYLPKDRFGEYGIRDATCFVRDFSGLVRRDIDDGSINDDYNLLGMVWTAK